MKKYYGAVIAFALILIGIYLLVKTGYVLPAKILGILLVVSVSFMIRLWMKRLSKMKTAPDSIKLTINHKYELKNASPWYSRLAKAEKHEVDMRLRKLLPQLRFNNELKEVDQDEALLVSLYIIMANYTQDYQSCVNKSVQIVADIEDSSALFDKNRGVKVVIEQVKQDLLQLNSLEELGQISSNYPQILNQFYIS